MDLSGMSISDDPPTRPKFVFPAGTMLDPGEYLLLYADNETGDSGIHLGFALDGDGEGRLSVRCGGPGGAAALDSVAFGPQIPDLSIGRVGHDGLWTLTAADLRRRECRRRDRRSRRR